MASSSDTLRFCFPAYGDSVLGKINALRQDRRFCDVTLLLGTPQGIAVTSTLRFHGHRVVLAASSDFLRDQFLLHEGRPELSVAVVPNVEVGRRLLLSCYTGLLEVPLRELVSYLTAASALQMSQVVERCAQAVSHYLDPTLAHLKVERPSKVDGERDEAQLPDTAQPTSSLRDPGEVSSEVGAPHRTKSEVGAMQGQDVGCEGQRPLREHSKLVKTKVEFTGETACGLEAPESEEDGEIQQVHTNSHSYQHATVHRRKQRPPTPFRNRKPFSISGSPDPQSGQADSSQDQGERGPEGSREDGEALATHLQDGGESRVLAHLSGGEPGGDADSLLAQRPFLCRRCDRVFQHLEGYVSHLKEHRQYLCLLCGKSFSQKSNLTRHIRVHTGVKPFRCPLCHKTFSQKATLQDHLNLHTGDKPHKCNYCAVHFAHKPGLRRHLKDIHGKSSLQNVLEEIVD